MELLDYEKRHIEYLEKNAQESCLFLKRNDKFPLASPTTLCLVGNGARNTIKGGTGSGDVASRFFVSALDGFKNAGFKVVSEEWMDKYDAFKETTKKEYVKDTKKAARKSAIFSAVFSMGYFEEEKNYDFDSYYEADTCVYVLSRNSGEGNDRRNIKGDVKLSDKEVKDILDLNKKFDRFLLVLNVGGVVDLSPIMEVENILLLSQLGVVTGTILSNIVLGKANPSGKLSTTWTVPETYPYFNEFGNLNDTYYKEGVYVGYRYFESVKNEKPKFYYPFGYGKSYSEFEISSYEYNVDGTMVTVSVDIKNVSAYPGKEVLEVYVTSPTGTIDKPYLVLAGFNKSKELKRDEKENVSVSFDLKSVATYSESLASYVLEKGKYVIRVGNSIDNLYDVFTIELKDDFVTEKLENKCGKPGFDDLKITREAEELDIPNVVLEIKDETKRAEYKKHDAIDERLKELTDDELMLMTLGHHKSGIAAVVGSSSNRLVGGAGETTLSVKSINKSLSMADGPAGLRLIQKYGIDKKGIYNLSIDPIMIKMMDFLPKVAAPFVAPMPNKKRKGEIHYQYTTAIPIGTALAQSFNLKYVEDVANLVREELDIFDCDLWLAPALNIHRNILCGRNFEYFSEDPYLSGMMASVITKGIQKGDRGTTIKHFCCNNQELNRNNNNSHVSERALREIYLKGFEIAIKESSPKALMTSYNLLNGVHTSESYELINDILRCEWGYDGLVMTDWIASGRSFTRKHEYPAPYASNNIKAGNDLTMSGSPRDERDIKKALKKKTLTREDLLISASRIYKAIEIQRK